MLKIEEEHLAHIERLKKKYEEEKIEFGKEVEALVTEKYDGLLESYSEKILLATRKIEEMEKRPIKKCNHVCKKEKPVPMMLVEPILEVVEPALEVVEPVLEKV